MGARPKRVGFFLRAQRKRQSPAISSLAVTSRYNAANQDGRLLSFARLISGAQPSKADHSQPAKVQNMVGDRFGDARLRIAGSRELVRQVRIAVLKSKKLVADTKTWLTGYRAVISLRESGRTGGQAPRG